MSKQRKSRIDESREAGGFVALPWSVIDSPAFQHLSHPARSLLIEIARQYVRDNNGKLLASGAYLAKRGWHSSEVIVRAKRDLIEAGFIHETVKGHRPNKASWYAVTWYSLDRLSGFDFGAAETFRRGAYRQSAQTKNATLTPSRGVGRRSIAPSRGVERASPTPSGGAIRADCDPLPTPSDGDHLDKPSAALDCRHSRTLIGRMLRLRLAARTTRINPIRSHSLKRKFHVIP